MFDGTESGIFDEIVDFAGESYEAGLPVEATYQFNSWRVGYRYLFKDGEKWTLWVGFTAKIRDAKIALSQGGTSSEDTDVGFVPLLSFAANYRFAVRRRHPVERTGETLPSLRGSCVATR